MTRGQTGVGQFRAWGALASYSTVDTMVERASEEGLWNLREPWTNAGPDRPSRLLRTDLADIQVAMSLRRDLTDVVMIQLADSPRTTVTVRDGLTLHFEYETPIDVGIAIDEQFLSALLAHLRRDITPLGLLPVSASLRLYPGVTRSLISRPNTSEFDPTTDGEWLGMVELISPTLVFHAVDLDSPEDDPLDLWYRHVVSCLAAHDVREAARDSMDEVSHVLRDVADRATATHNDVSFDRAHAASHDLTRLRSDMAIRMIQREEIDQFRRLALSSDRPTSRAALVGNLDLRYAAYYADPLDVALTAMRSSVEEVEHRTNALLQLANLSYNMRIQVSVRRLQLISTVLAVVSLLVAVVALVISL